MCVLHHYIDVSFIFEGLVEFDNIRVICGFQDQKLRAQLSEAFCAFELVLADFLDREFIRGVCSALMG